MPHETKLLAIVSFPKPEQEADCYVRGAWVLEEAPSSYMPGTLLLHRKGFKTRKKVSVTLTPTETGFSIHVQSGAIQIITGYNASVRIVADKMEG